MNAYRSPVPKGEVQAAPSVCGCEGSKGATLEICYLPGFKGETWGTWRFGSEMESSSVLKLVSARKGHFLLESGHHGELWLDLETLCLRPWLLKGAVCELAEHLAGLKIVAVCGPLVEGAFVGLMVAAQLEIPFSYSERFSRSAKEGLFPMGYRVPSALREGVRGKRVAIVNDVINAGSAVKGTYEDLQRCGATVVAIGALLVLGSAAAEFAGNHGIELFSLATLPNNLWTAGACPLCQAGIPLQDIEGFAAAPLS